MTPERIPGSLFAAALLSTRKDLNHRVRSSILSRIPSSDVYSLDEAAKVFSMAFQEVGLPPGSGRCQREATLRAAYNRAVQWIRDQVFVLTHDDLKTREAWMRNLPAVFFAHGDRSILQLPAAAILNSRKRRQVSPSDRWLQATKRLVGLAIQEGFTIVSSYGNIPYCTVSRLSRGRPMIVACQDVLPFMASDKGAFEFWDAYRDLFDVKRTLFISPFPPGARPSSDVRSAERDHLVAALASILLVAEVREGGNMRRVLDIATKERVRIIGYSSSSFETPPSVRKEKLELIPGVPGVTKRESCEKMSQPDRRPLRTAAANLGQIQVQLVDLNDLKGQSPWLIHYTRSCPGPWPGQTIAEYCKSLIEGHGRACHTAFDTLVRILEERVIRASARLTRGSCRVVSFTQCLPVQIDTLIKWRKGLGRWSFEPYGIALPRRYLAALGARPVVYGTKEDFEALSADLKYLFQVQCSSPDTWTKEQEWRWMGDLLLTDALCEEMVVIVPTQAEAKAIAQDFGCKVALAEISVPTSVRRPPSGSLKKV